MTEITEKDFNHLQGRIIALEILVRSWLAEEMLQANDPVSYVDKYKAALFGSMQHAERQIDEKSEAIYAETISALEGLFAATAIRVKNILANEK